ncbi:thioredoxin [Clostridium sp. ZS2-4]|uniref:thioredoxin n=1 Tax=Clostridium sp. ZS2-4 TaxID=2987703 RepID=UPI00227B5267|nr:thioredoxin [Clostridium sp. ZS2-4]MCY6356517.1 thioredoxin [Clostridium sp. ZS2-4]
MVKEVTDTTFTSELNSEESIVVVDFWAPWCGPCRMLSPIMEQLSSELVSKVKFIKINVDSSPLLAKKFRISSIPTIMIFKEGKLKKTIIGSTPKNELIRTIKKFL